MNVHIFQHVPFEGPAAIEPWLRRGGHAVSFTRFYEHSVLPPAESVDGLVVMGGPMSAGDEVKFPWLPSEKRFIEQAISKGAGILGICLGAQLLAEILGARVYRAEHAEIGWHHVDLTEEGVRSGWFPPSPSGLLPFHWHGDAFDLPPGASGLAFSRACEHQAFSCGSRILGLQFHLESTPESVELLIRHGRSELDRGAYVQSEAEIRNPTSGVWTDLSSLTDSVLHRLMDVCGEQPGP